MRKSSSRNRKDGQIQLPFEQLPGLQPPVTKDKTELATPKTLERQIQHLGGRPYFFEGHSDVIAYLLPTTTVETLAKHKPDLIEAWIDAKDEAKRQSSSSISPRERLTKKEALGVGSAAFAAAKHVSEYPSALGFLKFTVTRIAELTAKDYGRPINSIPVALAYGDTAKEIFTRYAINTLFADVLEPELIDKFRNADTKVNAIKEAAKSYIKQALTDLEKPLHPASRALALAVNSATQLLDSQEEASESKVKKLNIVLIQPTFTEEDYKKEFNAEYRLVKGELIGSRQNVIHIKRMETIPENPIHNVSIVVLGDECSPNKAHEVQKKFPGAQIIFLNSEESFAADGQASLMGVIKEPPKWNHGMDPEPKKRRR